MCTPQKIPIQKTRCLPRERQTNQKNQQSTKEERGPERLQRNQNRTTNKKGTREVANKKTKSNIPFLLLFHPPFLSVRSLRLVRGCVMLSLSQFSFPGTLKINSFSERVCRALSLKLS